MPGGSNRVPLRGSTKKHSHECQLLTDIPSGEFRVTVMVRRKTPLPPLESPIGDTKSAGVTPSRQQLGLQYGADPADLKKVELFAEQHGLRVLSSDPERRSVSLLGTAQAYQSAFGVQLQTCTMDGRTYRSRVGDIYIPAELSDIITSVTGLDNRPFARPHVYFGHTTNSASLNAGVVAAPSATTPATAAAFTPPQVAALYNFPKQYNGAGQTIAIVELAGGFRQAELTAYFNQLGITPPNVTVADTTVYPHCGQNSPGTNPLAPGNYDIEVMTDILIAASVAPGAKIVVYFAPGTDDQSFLEAVVAMVHDSHNNPTVASISWGHSEDSATDQFKQEMDQALQFAAQSRMTVCVASGDRGSADFPSGPGWDGKAHVDFPASDPYALACGGTAITAANGSITSEVTWYAGPNIGSGGGVSRYFPLPAWQQNAGVPAAKNPAGPIMRGVPDVAADAASESGYRIVCDGQQFPDPARSLPAIGGTSAVAPLWAGLVACINQAIGSPIGFINPFLYSLPAGSGVFRDITVGTNGDYTAGPGWDPCTGLGSANGAELLRLLQNRGKP